ncbi:hypothetical protein ACSNOI_35020 [Actinomadura kijaniata]|uniref:hypothetical protein n=1 Tax=Actinomadura kijaniata TaxID=46161 RepID=UPI003F195141
MSTGVPGCEPAPDEVRSVAGRMMDRPARPSWRAAAPRSPGGLFAALEMAGPKPVPIMRWHASRERERRAERRVT